LEALEAAGELAQGGSKSGMIMPADFLRGMRAAMEAGLNHGQIMSLLVMFLGMHEMLGHMSEQEMLERSAEILDVIERDLNNLEKIRQREEGQD